MYISPWTQALLLPRVWDVCGVVVPPLSLWHRYILRVVGNPYIYQSTTGKDAAAEVLIYSSLDVTEGRKLYTDHCRRERLTNKIVKKLEKMSMEDVDDAINEYVKSCLRVPGHKVKDRPAGVAAVSSVTAPVEFVLASWLAAGNPDKIDSAFNVSYSMAMALFDASRNAKGEDDSLIDDVSEERTDRKLEEMAKIERGE